MSALTVAEVRARAADYIETHGWCTGQLVDEQGRVCPEGAVRAVIFGHPHSADIPVDRLFQQVMNDLDDDAERVSDDAAGDVVTWNDLWCAGQAEAVAFLRGTLAVSS